MSEQPPARPPVRRPTGPSTRPAPRRPVPPPRTSPSLLIGLGGSALLIVVLAGALIWLQPSSGGSSPVANPPAGQVAALTPVPPAAAPAAGTTAAPPAVDAKPTAGPTMVVPPIAGLTAVAITDRSHVTAPQTYPQVPPIGGPHFSDWQNCGVYAKPIQNELAVHSLEHGAIWITYQPTLAADQVTALQTLAHATAYRLLSPYPGLPHPIVVTAWGYQLPVDKADDPRIKTFLSAFEQNPNGPEPSASCSGSKSMPAAGTTP